MKKVVSMLLVVGILLSVAVPTSMFTYAEQNNSVTFSVSSADGSKGDIIPISISISGKSDIGTLKIDLPIPTDYLSITTIEDKRGNLVNYVAGDVIASDGAVLVCSNQISTLSDGSKGVSMSVHCPDGLWEAGELVTFYFKVQRDLPESGIRLICLINKIIHFQEREKQYNITTLSGFVTQPKTKKAVTFTVGSAEGKVGDIIPVSISVSECSDIGVLELELPVPENYLAIGTIEDRRGNRVNYVSGETSVEANATVVASEELITLSDGNKGVKMAAATVDGLWTEGAVITFYFEVIRQLPSAGVMLTCSATNVNHYENTYGVLYDVTVVPGYVSPKTSSQPQNPPTPNLPTLTPVPTDYGDIDGNEKVTAADALEILKAVVGKVQLGHLQEIFSDVDENNKIEAADALNVLKKVVGKIKVLPVPQTVTSNAKTGTFTIRLASIWADNYSAADDNGYTYQDTFDAMQKKGITTQIASLDANTATDTIVKGVMAGKSSADVYEVSQVMCRNIAKKKASVNIYDSKTLNKSLFKCAATESVTFNGKAYGITWPTKGVNPLGVFYNKNLIAKYASEYDILDLYNKKQWNFDTFQAIAKACTVDTDNDGKANIYGFTSNTNVIGMAVTSNAGGMALKSNEKVKATMCSDAGIQALEWCKAMFKTDKSWLYKADINQCVWQFGDGNAAMFASYLAFYPSIAYYAGSTFDVGFVLMPMGPAQTTYKTNVYDGAYYIVPKTKAARLDDIGHWLNEMAQGTGTELLNNETNDLAYAGFDTATQAIYRWCVNNSSPDFSSGVFSSLISSQVDSSVTSAAKQPATVMAAIKTQAQQECDDYYADIYDYSK